MEERLRLNKGQQAAVAAIRSGANVFVTGEGGTGKSVAIREAMRLLQADGRKVVLCAPTGIAAQQIGGTTIHSAFRFDLAPKVADVLEGVRPSKVIHEADVVIIDEIGMVRRDLMDAIARVIERENEERGSKRPHLQLVAVGDFSQLPPVATEDDKPVLHAQYGKSAGLYAFEADGWKAMDFETCQLIEPMRQADPVFVEMLNRARIGDRSCLPYFNSLAHRGPAPSEAVSIVARNKDAERVNLGRLESIGSEPEELVGTVTGEFRPGDMAAPKFLNLKEGARVICVANNSEAGYLNGMTGTVMRVRAVAPDGSPAVAVLLDGGSTVAVTQKTWENIVYEVVDSSKGKKHLEQVVLGTYTQFPLKLAWAITYHKSQGQTLSAISINPSTFGSGMLYVGLSRATSAAGVWLTREIVPRDLRADKGVVRFYEKECGWVPPKPATGDEAPDLAAPQKTPEALASEHRGAESSGSLEGELHGLLASRSWTKVYACIDQVYRRKLYRPAYSSFTAWMKAEAKRAGVAESALWHKKSAGDFYKAWAAGRPDAPALDSIPEENINLVRKIAKEDSARADALMESVATGSGPSTEELRREWRRLRASTGSSKQQQQQTAKTPVALTCSDAATLEAAAEALRAAGFEVELHR